MAGRQISMRKIKETLRQRWEVGLSCRLVAESLGVSASQVSLTCRLARSRGLTIARVNELDEGSLEAVLFGEHATKPIAERELPDFGKIHAERKRKGVTLTLLHMEYLQVHPQGVRYSQFCNYYRAWLKKHSLTMRQEHICGEKLFVDYAGMRPHLTDPTSGEKTPVELFVCVLGASSYTYAEATRTQRSHDFISSHVRAFSYFGGVPKLIVPDQLKSGVTSAHRYEPTIQRTYEEMATHYGTAVMPARPRKPRDKAKVEVGVQVAERWILAALRDQTFFSLEALNERIFELLESVNTREMRGYGKSRQELFRTLEKPALMSLPAEPFVYGDWKTAKVNIDYHIEALGHYYSVPHALVRESVDVRITAMTVEVFHRGVRVGSHVRNDAKGRHTTDSAHMPKSHQKHMEWTPSRIISWAASIGLHTQALVESILTQRPHPEMGYRSCLGILRLAKRYDNVRLEAACARALLVNVRSYRHVDSILKHGLDRVPLPESKKANETPLPVHENIRGRNYYH